MLTRRLKINAEAGTFTEQGEVMSLRRERRKFSVLMFMVIVLSLITGMLLMKFFDSSAGQAEAKIKPPEGITARLFEPPVPLQTFALTDHKGEIFNPVNFLGNWSFIFFGYTNCPDVCPVALVDLNAVYSSLESKFVLGNTQVLFVSVDPQRDNLKHLQEYVTYFNENFIGLTGASGQVDAFAKQLGAVYKSFASGSKDKDYLVDHTASIMLVDHVGRLVAIFPPPHDPKRITAEFLKLRERYGDGYDCILKS